MWFFNLKRLRPHVHVPCSSTLPPPWSRAIFSQCGMGYKAQLTAELHSRSTQHLSRATAGANAQTGLHKNFSVRIYIYTLHIQNITLQMSLLRNVEEEIVAQKHLNLQSVYSILQQIMMWIQGLQCQVTGIHLAQTAKVLEVMKLAHTTDACNITRSISANATLKPKMRKEHQLAPDSDHQNTRNSCPAVHLSYSCWMS